MVASTSFPQLLAPGRIGSLELRNRILMCPMGDSLCEHDGSISRNQQAYFEARARGGAALLLVGSVSVAYPRASFDDRQVAASDDAYLPGLSDLTAAVHSHGAHIAAQLVHNGLMSLLDVANGLPMLVPSVPKPPHPDRLLGMVTEDEMAAMMSPYTQPTSKAEYQVASESDIAWVIERFVDAGERCVRAGFDGIEVHAGHGYLIDEFLSPAVNTRTDGWGGNVGNRARLLCDVIRALRARLGDEYPLWIRINAVEHHKTDGETFEEQQRVIELAIDAGINAVHVTAYANTDVATGPTDSYAPHTVASSSLSDYAAAVRARFDVPVITFGRYEPDEAEGVLAAGKADFVAMGRKLLADPDLPNKLAEGRVDDVRPCIYQYRCIGNIFVKESLHCVANAATGREHDLAIVPAPTAKRVLVVGGGPAGLETARLLAQRGHAVSLWEASERLGGMLALAARADPLLDRYLGWLMLQVERADVSIELGRKATADAVAGANADEVIVATGATWGAPGCEGSDLAHVLTVPALRPWLDGDADGAVGGSVAIIGGGKAGLSIADLCLRRNRTVTLVEPTNVLGVELGLPGRWRLVHDLEEAGAQVVLNAKVGAITERSVNVSVNGDTQEITAETVIVTNGGVPNAALAESLQAVGVKAHSIGDCDRVAGLEGANLAAANLALAI